jgi:hypothetical protein
MRAWGPTVPSGAWSPTVCLLGRGVLLYAFWGVESYCKAVCLLGRGVAQGRAMRTSCSVSCRRNDRRNGSMSFGVCVVAGAVRVNLNISMHL